MPVAEPALAETRRLQARLSGRVGGVRWARPETLHITVHFFGTIDDAHAARVVHLVSPVVARTPPFDVELGRLGSFPPRGAPRVLWLGPTAEVAELGALARECRTVLRDAGFDIDSRPYHPHCTLGRPRASWGDVARTVWASAVTDPVPATRFSATRLVLYESRPAPGGAVYMEWSGLPLAGR